MGNFCTNCGAKLENDYNYCINCGIKIDKSEQKHNNPSLELQFDQEKQIARNELKRIVGGGILFKTTFSQELLRNGLDYDTGKFIKQQLEKEIDSGQIKSADVENRINQLILECKIKKEKKIAEEEARRAKQNEIRREKIENSKPASGGYCGFNCIHYFEEYMDNQGSIVGDMDMGGYVEYYCNLGHHISDGRYCKDYE